MSVNSDILDAQKTLSKANKMLSGKDEGAQKINEEYKSLKEALDAEEINYILKGEKEHTTMTDERWNEIKEGLAIAKEEMGKAIESGEGVYEAAEKYKELLTKAQQEVDQSFIHDINENNKEEKNMEQNQKITTKQAFKAIGRNFKRWCGEHKWQIGAAVVGSALATYGWYKSSQIVDGDNDGLSGLLDAIEKDAKTNPHYEKQTSGTYRYLGTEHGTQKNDECKTWMNWKAENDMNLYSTVIIEPMDRLKEFDPKPDQVAELLKSIGEDYAKDYPHREEGIWTDIYADGTSKTTLDDGTVVTEF